MLTAAGEAEEGQCGLCPFMMVGFTLRNSLIKNCAISAAKSK
jgi:hypothetical protein